MADFTIRELQGLAKKNPSAEWVSGFVGSLEKGEFDEAARKQGVDISKISPTYKQSITEDVSQVQDRIGERQEQRTQDINMLKSQQDSLQGNEAIENARQIRLKKNGKTAESIGNLLNLTSFGEGIGVAADEIRGKLSKNYDSVSEINEKRLDQLLQTQDSILGKLKEATESGDTETVEKMKALLQQSGDDLHKLDIDVSERINELPSNKEVIGSALSLATLAAGGTIARGAGTLATKAIPALATPATSVIGGITQGAIKGAAVATPVGLVEGVGRGITAEKDAKGVIGQSLTSGALAGLGGGVFGGIAGGVSTRNNLIRNRDTKLKELINNSPTDKRVAKFMQDGQGKIVNDPVAKESIRLGVDEGSVALAKGSNPETKAIMSEMTDLADAASKNKRITERPMDLVGNKVMDRYKVVVDANKNAGKRLDGVARSLRGKKVNIQTPINSFKDDLIKQGVKFTDEGLDFTDSIFVNNKSATETLENVYKQALKSGDDAFKGHQLKIGIDETVGYGKNAEGLSGRAESLIKKLRSGVDGALDTKFSAYNKVNTQYSTTIDFLDRFNKAAGSKFDPTSPLANINAGQVVRRTLGNASSRASNIQLLQEADELAKLFGKEMGDDLVAQALWADTLETVYGTQAVTSLQGEVSKAVTPKGVAGVAKRLKDSQGLTDLILDVTGDALIKMKNVDEEALFNSIKALLK